jgi:hypothetical protein
MINSLVLLIHNITRKEKDPELSVLWLIVFMVDILNVMVILFVMGLIK